MCRRDIVRFVAAMAAYIVLLYVARLVLKGHEDAAWRFAVALTPMIPALFVLLFTVNGIRRMDELQQRMQLEALAFAFGGTAIGTFSYGFLQNVGLPGLSWHWVWPVMGSLWLVGLAVAHRRYR